MYSTAFGLLVFTFTALASAGPPRSGLCSKRPVAASSGPGQWSTGTSEYSIAYPSHYSSVSDQGPGFFSSRCYTSMGTSSVPWAESTSYSTLYTSCSSTTTITSTVTSAPSSVTTTVTSTSTATTTAPTDSYTSTVTATTTATESITVTATTTTTTTSTDYETSTSTVPTSTGFIPVQISLPGAACDANCGADPVTKRRRALIPDNEKRVASSVQPTMTAKAGVSKNQYQQGVRCFQYQSSTCSTFTETTTTTVQGTLTGTVTSTAVTTVTSTVNPSATITTTTTSTTTTTNTITSTSTSTSTTVTTSIVSTTTVYAACATNNLADVYNGLNLENLYSVSSNPDVNQTPTNTGYECCVAAFTSPDFAVVFEFDAGVCTFFTNADGAQCAGQNDNQIGVFAVSPGTVAGAFQSVVGNANCGIINEETTVTT